MNITPQEAQEALNNIHHATTKANTLLNIWSYYTLFWGIVWTAGFLVTQVQPQLVGWIWGVLIAVGFLGSAIIGFKQGSQMRTTPGSHAAFMSSRLGIFYGILYAFAILWLIIFPLSAMQIGMLWITVVMFGTIIGGVWIQERVSILLGISVTIVSVIGYYLLPVYFWLWAAVFAGLPMIGVSIYHLRKK